MDLKLNPIEMDEYYEYLGEQGIDLVGDNDNEEGPNNRQITKQKKSLTSMI